MPASTPKKRKPGQDGLHIHSQKAGVLTYLPLSWVPYAELMRLHKPGGTMNIFFPYLFGSLFAGCVSNPLIRPKLLLMRVGALLGAAFVLRSAGCSWNDIADRELDRLVERTRLRPMARGAISLPAAYVFTAAQVGIWLAALSLLLPGRWPLYAGALLFLLWLYPFTKRFTHYAQLVLGIMVGSGVLIGAAVVGLDVSGTDAGAERAGLAGLYLVCVVMTVIYDIVYAHQDVRDDMKAGIKSMAVLWLHWTRALLWVFSFVQIGILWSIGIWIKAGGWYHCVAVGGNVAGLLSMVIKLDPDDPRDCLWWFQRGSLLVGGTIAGGLWGEYFARIYDDKW